MFLNECIIFIQVYLFFKEFFIMKQKSNYLVDIKITKNVIIFVAYIRKLLYIFLKNFRNLWIITSYLHLILNHSFNYD